MSSNNLPEFMPILKLVFQYESKTAFTELSEEIKSMCGEPEMDFYFGPDSFAFIIEKELSDGEPWYSILVYQLTRGEFEEMNRIMEEIMKELENQ